VRAFVFTAIVASLLSGCATTPSAPLVWTPEMERTLGPQLDMEDAVTDGILDADMLLEH
jgi:hypothetical protein